MQADIFHILWPYIYKGLVGTAVAGIGALMVWPFRFLKNEWRDLKGQMQTVQVELTQQRENHLTHIEANGKTQVDLLTKACDILDGVRLDLREQTTILRMVPVPKPARSRAKK